MVNLTTVKERIAANLGHLGAKPGDRLVVGYSGGADSTALLHCLSQLDYDLIPAHLNHNQRPEAEQELIQCEFFARSLGLDFFTGSADVPLIAQQQGISLEEAGRMARYFFFERLASTTDATWILTAHTLDDRIETMLFNAARGSGLRGLAGTPARRNTILRPMIGPENGIRRAETRAYCETHNLWFHDDPANTDVSLSRARIRHRVLPELELAHPGAFAQLARLSEIAEAEDEFFDLFTAGVLEKVEIPLNGNLKFLTQNSEVALNRKEFEDIHPVLVPRGCALIARILGSPLEAQQLDALITGLKSAPHGSVSTSENQLTITWDADTLHFTSNDNSEPFRYPLTLPGETFADVFGWMITAQSGDSLDVQRAPDSLDIVFNRKACPGPLYFRAAEPGDHIRPLGTPKPRPLNELLSTRKLTPLARRRIPVICDLLGPFWVPGVALDERARVQPGDPCVRLTFAPLPDQEL